MACVIEFDVKALQCGKQFDLSSLSVRMTDRTDGAARIGELLCVAACTGQMTRKSELWRIVWTTMAQKTWEAGVLATGMGEVREVSAHLLCCRRS